MKSLLERFNKYVDRNGPVISPELGNCWNWVGFVDDRGYGRISVDGRNQKAHRISFILNNGPIEGSLLACHKCDNPRCVRPEHLFLGTNKDNMADMQSKKRAVKTHCRRGHEMTPDNEFFNSNGNRTCLKCKIAYRRNRYHQHGL